MKHETRLLNLEIKSKNSPMLFASSYTEIWRQTLFCKQVTCFQGLPGSYKSKTSSMWPPPHIYLPNTIQMNLNGQNSCAHTHKNQLQEEKKGYKRQFLPFQFFQLILQNLEQRLNWTIPNDKKKKKQPRMLGVFCANDRKINTSSFLK